MSTKLRVSTALASAIIAGPVLTACGGGAGPEATPSGTTGPIEPSGSASASASVEPASGPAMSNTGFTLHLPDGWTESTHLDDLGNVAHPGGARDNSSINVSIADNYGQPTDLDKMVAINLRTSTWAKKPERVEDSTLGGLPAYHLTGPSGAGSAAGGPGMVLDVYGALHDGVSVDIEFELEGKADERQAVVDSVLATWKWK